jgi:hypothetical protein
LIYTTGVFLAACEENETAPCPEEEQNDDQPHPGEEWNDALEHACELEEKRLGFSSSPYVYGLSDISTVGCIFTRLRKMTHELEKEIRENPLPVDAFPGVPPKLRHLINHREDKFKQQHILRFKEEIKSCGQVIALAWLNRDARFFTMLSDKVTIALGGRRKKTTEERTVKDTTIEERLINVAVSLWYDENCNPSRESVIKSLEDEGIKIRAKDQSGYFKRCKLEFLKSIRGRGRPRKNIAVSESKVDEHDQAALAKELIEDGVHSLTVYGSPS